MKYSDFNLPMAEGVKKENLEQKETELAKTKDELAKIKEELEKKI